MKMVDALAGHRHEHGRHRLHGTATTTETNGSLLSQVVNVPLTNTAGSCWEETLDQHRAAEEARKHSQDTDGQYEKHVDPFKGIELHNLIRISH